MSRRPSRSAIRNPLIAYRLGLTLVLASYLAGISATGYVLLTPALDVPFGVSGWLLFAGVALWGIFRRQTLRAGDIIASLFRPAPLAGAFAILVLITSYFALAWQLPPECHGISMNCFKGYEWTAQGDYFSHVTAGGVSEKISRARYILEVGVHLRSAAAFGVYSLCFAWAAAMVLDHSAKGMRHDAGRAGEI